MLMTAVARGIGTIPSIAAIHLGAKLAFYLWFYYNTTHLINARKFTSGIVLTLCANQI